jgi:outer membrane protein TolC
MQSARHYFLFLTVPAWLVVGGCSLSPNPLSDPELFVTSSVNAERTTMAQEPIAGPVSLHEAMARALKYNLDYRLEMMQQALRGAETGLATADLLPKLVSSAGYSGRNNDLIVSSLDVPTGQSFEPNTISQEKEFNSGDVNFSWDILDFALSYVRAKQASDKYLIAQETKRKVIQRIIEDTRTAYWRAVSADRMSKKLEALGGRVSRAISGSHTANEEGAQSPLTALSYERELVQIKKTAEELEHELNLAKSQLAALMNVAPGTKFTVVDQGTQSDPKYIDMSAQEMVAEAIFNRPEIREVAYEKRITEQEANAAILELLPNIKEYGADVFNDNRFLLNNNWLSWGTTVAGNLMKIVQLPERQFVIDANAALLEQRALATTMVVMTQVYVSRTRYKHFLEELGTAKQYAEVQAKLVEQLRAEASSGSLGDQTLIREEMNLLVAEVERDVAVANLENASANLLVSMGLDLQPKEVNLGLGVKELAGDLKSLWADRIALSDRGKYLLEIEKAKEEARRKQEEEERRIREEAQRIADEAQRVKDEEVRRAKEEIRLAQEEAAKQKAERERIAKEEAHRIKEEARLAKEQAEREKAEQARIAKEEAQRAKAEALQARQEAEHAKNEQAHAAKEEARRLKEEAQAAKEAASRARQEEAQHARAEADAARQEAKRAKADEERSRDEARRVREAEIKQAKDEARLAKQEQERTAKSEVRRLQDEAKKAREDAKQARRDAVSGKAAKVPASAPGWKWVWPWEEAPAPANDVRKRRPTEHAESSEHSRRKSKEH